jgi:hypothetical protein
VCTSCSESPEKYWLLFRSVQKFLFHVPSEDVKIKTYRSLILPVVFYECETWSVTLREEHRLRVFENRVLRRLFGPREGDVTRGRRKLRNEELHTSYFTFVIKLRRMR